MTSPDFAPEPLPDPGIPTVDGYRLERVLGQGAHSTVWLAHPDSAGAGQGPVALKVLSEHSGRQGRRELAALTTVRHPHLVRLHAVTETAEGLPVLVLDYISGGTLERLVQARGPLGPGEVVTVLTPIAEVLAELHRRGIVHGDLSPANVLFGQDGRPLLADLGVALAVGVEEREFGSEGFTDEHTPGSTADPGDDVFGLAAIGAFALTGYPPPPAAVRPPLSATHPLVPLPLATLLDACLDGDRSTRPSASELAERAYASTSSEPVLLVPTDEEADPVHVVTQQVRRRLGPEWEELLRGTLDEEPADPEGERSRFNRSQLRRVVEEPPRPLVRLRLPRPSLPGRRTVIVLALIVVAGLGAGGAAAHFGVGQPVMSSKATSGSKPSAQPSAPQTASPRSPRSANASQTSHDKSSDNKPSATAATTPASAETGPIAAVQSLNKQRAEAISKVDRQALSKINVAGSKALSADLAIVDQLSTANQRVSGLSFTLSKLALVSTTADQALVSAVTTTSAHDVLAMDGTLLDHTEASAPRSILIKLTRTGQAWQVDAVTS